MHQVIIDLGSIFGENGPQHGTIGFCELYVGLSRARTKDGVRLLVPPALLQKIRVTGIKDAERKNLRFSANSHIAGHH